MIVPWWNHPELIGDFAEAVGSERADEVLIMDNASEPEVAHSLDELLGRRCGMTVVHRNTNSQLQALTEGVRLARNETIVFLNNDVVRRTTGWLRTLTAAIEPGVFCGAQLREAEGIKYLDGWCLGCKFHPACWGSRGSARCCWGWARRRGGRSTPRPRRG